MKIKLPKDVHTTQLLARALHALETARETIYIFHGETAWVEYQQSPEMQELNGTCKAISAKLCPPLNEKGD